MGARTPLLCLVPACLAAMPADLGPRTLRAARTVESIRMNGRLDEASWSTAPVLSDLTQLQPLLGAKSKKSTEIRVLYDDHFMYVGARMHHEPGKVDVVQQVHRRDQVSSSDWFAFMVDSAHDHRSAFSFMVNASNVQRDGIHYEDATDDLSWDGIWESSVSVDALGWTAKLKIPLSILRFHNGGGPLVWGVNFARRDEGKEREVSYWFVPPREENSWISRFNHLEDLEGLKPQPRREWIPYVSTQRKFETAQGYDDRKWTSRVGMDAHFGLNTHAQLDLTMRPDFGQVEVDQAVLNLSTVETFFPEKRPFFLEGMDIFQIPGAQLFYSRRIGKGLDGPDSGLDVMDWPRAAEIAAAGKFTTKTQEGLAIGVLGAGVEAARATLRDGSGMAIRQEVAPYTSAGVLRATQSLDDKGSYLGGFASLLGEAGPSGRSAGVGALDGAWKTPDRTTTLSAILAHSDAGLKGAARQGGFARFRVQRAWGKGWTLDSSAFMVTKDFNSNDLGYLERPDKKGFNADLTRRWDLQKGAFRNPSLEIVYSEFRDQAGKCYQRYGESQVKTEFTSDWDVFLGSGYSTARYDDREFRTFLDPVKKYLHLPSCHWVYAGLDSPPNLPWVVNLVWNRGQREGGFKDEVQLLQSFKPMPRIEFRFETSYSHIPGERHWLETQGTTPIVGMRKLGQLDQVLRISYAFSPALTVQVFSQWMAANWTFRDLQRYVNDDTLAPGATATVPLAYSDRLWNLNMITRWEFRPGSSLFLVYTHGAWTGDLINDRASLSHWQDLALMRHRPSDDVLQVKLSWLFR